MTDLIYHEIGVIYFIIGVLHLIPLFFHVAKKEQEMGNEGVYLWLAIFFGWMVIPFWLPYWIGYGLYWLSKRF